ncbi:hypothetical protein [Bacillus albus]|uniref:hypothetical protein n=1 Tax=Bacillus albus TaxID=2026189 RepID=UPI00256FAF6B|nr:hypothetical protein [Bacillus albus]WJE69354.1 hypothetical protein QRY64_21880 [Bacillus albus]HDR7432660.1 hypothetical protein [Bacillus anthracis]
MKFNIFKVSDSKKLLKITKKRTSFLAKKTGINTFHANELNHNFHHIVFHIPDEYNVGSKTGGNYINFPFSQYVNSFVFLDGNYFLVELINEGYTKEVLDYINQKTGVSFDKINFDSNVINRLVSTLNGKIKQVEYVNEEGDDQVLEHVKQEQFLQIVNNYDVEYVLLNVDDRLISLHNRGILSVDNSDEDYLIKFTEVIMNALVD